MARRKNGTNGNRTTINVYTNTLERVYALAKVLGITTDQVINLGLDTISSDLRGYMTKHRSEAAKAHKFN